MGYLSGLHLSPTFYKLYPGTCPEKTRPGGEHQADVGTAREGPTLVLLARRGVQEMEAGEPRQPLV